MDIWSIISQVSVSREVKIRIFLIFVENVTRTSPLNDLTASMMPFFGTVAHSKFYNVPEQHRLGGRMHALESLGEMEELANMAEKH